MKLELPESVKPIGNFFIHIGIGAIMFAGLLVIEVLLAGFIKLIAMVPFAPEWLNAAAEFLEQGLFGLDLFVAALFLLTEMIKFVRELWKEIRNG